ncbi:MAG TPA: hypothetical protein VF884_07650 [Nitrososphaeraceae archaeon]
MVNIDINERFRVSRPLMATAFTLGLFVPMILSTFILSSVDFIGFIKYGQDDFTKISVFALEGGEFRCTDGSVVNTASECPSTDQCPSSSEGNDLVQCTTVHNFQKDNEERASIHCSDRPRSSLLSSSSHCSISSKSPNAQENAAQTEIQNAIQKLQNETTTLSSSRNSLNISTDKKLYGEGEIINITLSNSGDQNLIFSPVNSAVTIKNLNTSDVYTPSSILTKSIIHPGQSKIFTWDQHDYTGQLVSPGDYSAIISIGPLISNSSFVISN